MGGRDAFYSPEGLVAKNAGTVFFTVFSGPFFYGFFRISVFQLFFYAPAGMKTVISLCFSVVPGKENGTVFFYGFFRGGKNARKTGQEKTLKKRRNGFFCI